MNKNFHVPKALAACLCLIQLACGTGKKTEISPKIIDEKGIGVNSPAVNPVVPNKPKSSSAETPVVVEIKFTYLGETTAGELAKKTCSKDNMLSYWFVRQTNSNAYWFCDGAKWVLGITAQVANSSLSALTFKGPYEEKALTKQPCVEDQPNNIWLTQDAMTVSFWACNKPSYRRLASINLLQQASQKTEEPETYKLSYPVRDKNPKISCPKIGSNYYSMNQEDIYRKSDDFRLRSCFTETCTDYTSLANGYYYRTVSYGDEGCDRNDNRFYSCSTGYLYMNGVCVVDNSSNSCPAGMLKTSRGCEKPVDCSGDQENIDNVCTKISFEKISGKICGRYDKPVEILAGKNTVTCNTSFKNSVKIQPGAQILVDNFWSVSFTDITAQGTADSPIIFDISTQTMSPSWASLTINPSKSLDYDFQTEKYQGSILNYVIVKGLKNGINISKTLIRNSQFSVIVSENYSPIDLTNLVMFNSVLEAKYINLGNQTFAMKNELKSKVKTDESIVALNKIKEYWDGNGYIYYNEIEVLSDPCTERFVGNKIASASSSSDSCGQKNDNSITAVGNSEALVLRGNQYSYSIPLPGEMTLQMLLLNKNGFIWDHTVRTLANYDYNGSVYKSIEVSKGLNQTLKFSEKESLFLDFKVETPGVFYVPFKVSVDVY